MAQLCFLPYATGSGYMPLTLLGHFVIHPCFKNHCLIFVTFITQEHNLKTYINSNPQQSFLLSCTPEYLCQGYVCLKGRLEDLPFSTSNFIIKRV